jgi:rRNA maturation endonuclease Nob1
MSKDKIYTGYKNNPENVNKIFINYKLYAYCKTCNMVFLKPKLNCPVCHSQLKQHSKEYINPEKF